MRCVDRSFFCILLVVSAIVCYLCTPTALAQQLEGFQVGDPVPRDVRELYETGLKYLVKSQSADGTWKGNEEGPGATSLALLAFLASGEDPNFGVYAGVIRKALRSVIKAQSGSTGYIGPSMYHHGFSLLALSEAYGAVDDSQLWENGSEKGKTRSIGEALELAVRCAVTAQKRNPQKAWRYSPESNEADTSVSGAVLMGLLAARNAGIEVPDSSIDQAINYFTSMSSNGGMVGYTSSLEGFGDSTARSSIAALVFAISKRKDVRPYPGILKYITSNMEGEVSNWPEYTRYYQAQALFQGDVEAWEKWNKLLVRKLRDSQNDNGSFRGTLGEATDTSMGLLALALNFRFLPIYER